MERQLETYQKIERSIIKKFRKQLWTPFIVAVKRYELIQAGDKIAVCISGGKDSMLMAILSPAWISSYRLTATINGVHSCLRNFLMMLRSIF